MTTSPPRKPAGLTVLALKNLAPRAEAYLVKDDAVTGGYVQVWPSGALSYVLRYRFQGAGRKLNIGKFNPDAGGLAEVRRQAREAQNARTSGADPSAQKREAKAAAKAARAATRAERDAAAPADLVETVVAGFIAHYASRHTRDWRETERRLVKDVVARWRGRRLSELTPTEVRQAFREFATRAPINANRTLAQFKKLCVWAVEEGLIEVSPAASVKAPTPEKGRARERVLDDRELALVWRAAERLRYPFGPIIQIAMLTGQRRGEVSGMSWDELDFEKARWTIPATRSKNGRSHFVALTQPVLAILKSLPRWERAKGQTDFVFSPGVTEPSGFSKAKRRLDAAMLAILREADPKAEAPPEFVFHDLRRTCATGMQRLGVALPVIEKALNHVSGSFGGLVSVYQKHAFEDETRDAFTRWGAHVVSLVDDKAKAA